MQVRVLGALEIVVRGKVLTLGGPRPRAVFAVLAVHANRVVSVDALAEEVWAGAPPPSATVTLQNYISRLRRLLQDSPAQIITHKPGYRLAIDEQLVDARRFEDLLRHGRTALERGSPAEAAELLRAALACWSGRVLADLEDVQLLQAERVRLEELHLEAFQQRLEADLVLGGGSELIADLEALVGQHPLREVFRGQLMRALNRSGRRADALQVYRDGHELMVEELGLDPDPALREIEQEILLDEGQQAGGDLPLEITSFVGREHERQEAVEHLRHHRLVTLTGTGGIGKTRLALQIARTLQSTGEGTCVVELGGLADPARVASRVSVALGVRERSDMPLLAALTRALRSRDQLLVLDNCEHLLDATAELAHALVSSCPGVRVLATSRESLGVAGEQVVPLDGLPVPPPAAPLQLISGFDATTLFIERARTTTPRFDPSPEELLRIAEICRRLDGIPLAIELAAARLRAFSVAQIAERLESCLDLLTSGPRSALPHQRTLRTTIAWSYDLLTPVEQEVFDRLSIFASPFTLEAAEAVADGHGHPRRRLLNVLPELVEKSLVQRLDGDAGPQFRVLETLAQYGLERLSQRSDDHDVRAAHARYFTEYAECAGPQLYCSGRLPLLESLERNHDDLRQALRWLLEKRAPDAALRLLASLWWFWAYRHHLEGLTWVREALAVEGASPEWRVEGLAAGAYLSWMTDDFDQATLLSEEGLRLDTQEQRPGAHAQLLATLAEVLRARDDLDRCEQLSHQALRLFQEQEHGWGIYDMKRLLAMAAKDRGDLATATALAEECLRMGQGADDPEIVATSQGMLAGLAYDRGELLKAAGFYDEALAGFRQLREPWGIGLVLVQRAWVAADLGESKPVAELADDALHLFEELGDQDGIASAIELKGLAALHSGAVDEALMLTTEALQRFRLRGFSVGTVSALQSAARVALERGDIGVAASLSEEATVPYRVVGKKRGAAGALGLLAQICSRQGRTPEALALYGESLALAREAANHPLAARSLEAMAGLVADAGDTAMAAAQLEQAQTEWTAAELPPRPADLARRNRVLRALRERPIGLQKGAGGAPSPATPTP